MSLEEKLDYVPYQFKFDKGNFLIVKCIDEIEYINHALKEDSPDSDYEGYSWYMTSGTSSKIKQMKLIVDEAIAWHGGLPFYRLKNLNGEMYTFAEFYLQECVAIQSDFNDLAMNGVFKKIPEKDGVHIFFRLPMKIDGLDAVFEKSSTNNIGKMSLVFLEKDVGNMSDSEIVELARMSSLIGMSENISVNKKGEVIYVSFGYHNITRIPGYT